MYDPSRYLSGDSISYYAKSGDYYDSVSEKTAENEDGTKCTIMADLLGTKSDFAKIGEQGPDNDLSRRYLEQNIRKVQCNLFKNPTFVEEQIMKLKNKEKEKETHWIQKKKILEEEMAREKENRANAFLFDFGHLDAEVHSLIKRLDSVYLHCNPMANTDNNKSMYSSSRANIERMGLKVILNRLCIIGKYKSRDASYYATVSAYDLDVEEDERKMFAEELNRIRKRADSILAKELGEITGCLLCYPKYFCLMLEGPELSILDVLHQAQKLVDDRVTIGCVFFIAQHVLVRFLNEWTDLIMDPPDGPAVKISEDVDEAKNVLVGLSEQCQRLWRNLARARRAGMTGQEGIGPVDLPNEQQLQYAVNCGLLRPLHVWLRRATNITYGDFTSETWPQCWYPVPTTAHHKDSQFDSLGVVDMYEDVPGMDQVLDEFMTAKYIWSQPRSLKESDDDTDVTRIMRRFLERRLSKDTMLTTISAYSATQYVPMT